MRGYYWVILFFCGMLLSACSDESGDVVAYVDNVKKTAGGKISTLPPAKKVELVDYTADNVRSPFDDSTVRQAAIDLNENTDDRVAVKQQPRPDDDRTRYFLEKYPLKTFTMVGTLKKENSMWGLVEDKSGLVHVVKVGDYMGQDSGHIVSITDDTIKLIETVPDGTGGWMDVNSELGLKQD